MSEIDNIYKLLSDDERVTLECKKATKGVPNSLWDTYSAFANTYGGTILMGVVEHMDEHDNTKRFEIVGVEDADKIRKDLWNTVNSREKVNINLLYDDDIQTVDVDSKKVIAINVPRADYTVRPVYINNNLSRGTFKRNHEGDTFTTVDDETYVPLYEGKMFALFNHHYAYWATSGNRPFALDETSLEELSNPNSTITPWYWVPIQEVYKRLYKTNNEDEIKWKYSTLLAFRDITTATTERTFVVARMPNCVLQSMLSSLVFDYATRQKCGRLHMSAYIVKQLPVLTPDQIPSAMQWQIVKRVAELCYFNHDMDGWASELWNEMNEEQQAELPQLGAQQPWIYDPERRAILQAELDAIFAHLYGLNTEDLRYILDPEDICSKGCINETFRVLKDNEIRQYGEYRTKRLVLEAWNKFGFNNYYYKKGFL